MVESKYLSKIIFSLLIITLIAVFGIVAKAETDMQIVESARQDFAKKEFKKSIELYSKIPASSDFWLEALEERAWSFARLGQYENALADLQSITSAVWRSQVGPETYMLSTFVSLKICAYKDVVKKINIFKQRMLPRIDSLQAIVDKPLSPKFWQMSEAIQNNVLTMSALGEDAEKYPRYFFRDKSLLAVLKVNDRLQVEKRMKELAQQDINEIQLNLKKMKIIDVELIQNVLMAEKGKNNQPSNLKFASIDQNQQLLFPITDDEVWVDEVGHFQVKAAVCPYSKRGAL